MPLSKEKIFKRAKKRVNSLGLTTTESKQFILYCKHNLNLLEKLNKGGFIIQGAIVNKDFDKEFKRISDINVASGNIWNNFLNLVGQTNTSYLTLTNPVNNIYKNFDLNDITMTLLWSYVTDTELIGRSFKRFINFELIYNSLNASQRRHTPRPNNQKITFNQIVIILKEKYNTYLFKDVDMDLRNAISHYYFNFINGNKNSGIWFYYTPYQASSKKKKLYYLPRLMLVNKKINLLLVAISLTTKPYLK